MFRHPSYYKKLRERNKSDRVISERQATASSMRAPGLGHKRQATSYKYPGPRPISNANKGLIHKRQAIEETVPHNDIEEAQASSFKHQAPRRRSHKRQASSIEAQASSPKRQVP